MLVALATCGCAQSWNWTTSVIDPNGGAYTSLKADGEGNVHLSYSQNGVLRYGFLPKNNGKWFVMPLANEALFTRLNLDPSGHAHICYTGPSDLHHFWFDGKSWKQEQVAPNSGTIQFSCSLGVSADGTVHVAWYPDRLGEQNILHFRYAVKRENVWYTRTLDYGPETGKWNSMDLDGQGNPHIAYSGFRNREFKYATIVNNEWKFEVIDNESAKGADFPVGVGNDLTVAKDGTPRVSYEDSLTVYYGEPAAGGAWKREIVDHVSPQPGWLDYRTRLAIDADGQPHLVYQDSGILKHAWRDSKGWNFQNITGGGASRYRFGSIASGPSNTLFVVYQDGDGALKFAVGQPGAGGVSAEPSKSPSAASEPTEQVPSVSASQPKKKTSAKTMKSRSGKSPAPAKPLAGKQ